MKTKKLFLAVLLIGVMTVPQIKAQSHQHMDHSKMKMTKESAQSKSIVREGIIDLKAIDKNKDGKVFQDQMDWNVLSDTPGKCPLCGMKLKEVTLEKAKENLFKHGFNVKGMPVQK